MKIAINKCFGGFGLSDAAHKRLIELGVPVYDDWDKIPEGDAPFVHYDANDKFYRYSSNFRDYSKRADPILIKAIEDVGIDKASGSFAKITIVEIPDGIDWEISDYDGIETVHEKHRSW